MRDSFHEADFRRHAIRIRAKLNFLIVGLVSLMGLTLGLYFVIMAPVAKIEAERAYFVRLTERLNAEMLVVSRLPYTSFAEGSSRLAAAGKDSQEAFADLAKVRMLPRINSGMRGVLEIIANLQALDDKQRAMLGERYEKEKGYAQEIFAFVSSVQPLSFYTADEAHYKGKKVALDAARQSLPGFMSALSIMNKSLETAIATIAENYRTINSEIARIQSGAARVSALIALLVVAAAIALALLFARSMALAIVGLARGIAKLKDGDLTLRTAAKGSDELALLAADLNATLDLLAASFQEIKQVSRANIDVKDRLIASSTEASSASTEIEANALSIARQFQTLNAHVEVSAASIGRIEGAMARLDSEISDEGAMVERVTASVTQMLASLENMSRITSRDRESSGKLVEEAGRGGEVFASASRKIAEIPESIGAIRDMAKVIQGIASRTNLLAMNAAIEAAHAGEAGAGFAVVADEIRTLSQASTSSSREIGLSIKAIVDKIQLSIEAGSSISAAFAGISGRISEVSSSMDELYASIGEIQSGSKDILEAMGQLRERSLKVREGSQAVQKGSAEISSAVGDLGRISSEVTSNIGEITAGITDIHLSIGQVAGYAEQVGAESARLDGELGRFRTSRD